MLLLSPKWDEHELLDSGNGMRLERYGRFKLIRPDPQVLWNKQESEELWKSADAIFEPATGKGERGNWKKYGNMPDKWMMSYAGLQFWAKLTPFKHTGIFPEQSVHWEWMGEKIKSQKSKFKNMNILNLFAYTGIASLVCANAGARVTHVDASRPALNWARENQTASGSDDKPIRWIPDDAIAFVRREIKRGVRYEGIIMDPPIFGHGPKGERWEFHENFPGLLSLCRQVLTHKPLFVIINAYAISASALMLENMLKDFELPGEIESGELVLREANGRRMLSTGIFARWMNEDM